MSRLETEPDTRSDAEGGPPPAVRTARPLRSRVRNWFLAGLGGLSLGLGILGIFVPGLPTTVFLIVASYLFTRSCPELDQWMRSRRVVQPYVKYLDGASIPRHVVPVILTFIWIGVTSAIVVTSGTPLTIGLLALGAVGSGVVVHKAG